jgi:ATP-dependent RNA helicase SUPV3L1/SUV3
VAGATEDSVQAELRGRLKALGVRAGRHALFMPAVLKPRVAACRAALWALSRGVPVPSVAAPGLVSLAEPPADWPEGFAPAMGWVAAGPVLLRLDVAERVAAELAWSGRFRPIPIPSDLASRLAVRADVLPAVLRGLGFRLLPAEILADGAFGPPCPPLMAPPRRRPIPSAVKEARTPPAAPVRDGPFAALAALRRF